MGIIALGDSGGGGMRPLLLGLIVLAILLLLAGAVLAVIALRHQRKDELDVATLERLEDKVG